MSVAHRQVEIVSRAPDAGPAADVTVRWRVAAACFTPGARGTTPVEITVRRDEVGGGGGVWIDARVVTPQGPRVVRTLGPLDASTWWTDANGLEHVEAGPTLRATLRPQSPSAPGAVLFAQTDILAELGLAGGRYDRPR